MRKVKSLLITLFVGVFVFGCFGLALADEENVAMIGETGYATLQDAIDDVPDDGAEPTTITLLQNIDLAERQGLSIVNKNIILDTNGKTIGGHNAEKLFSVTGFSTLEVKGGGAIINTMHGNLSAFDYYLFFANFSGQSETRTAPSLYIHDISAECNGSIYCDGILVQSVIANAAVTIENTSITAYQNTVKVYDNDCTVNVIDSEISADMNKSALVVGTFISGNEPDSTITVSGGAVIVRSYNGQPYDTSNENIQIAEGYHRITIKKQIPAETIWRYSSEITEDVEYTVSIVERTGGERWYTDVNAAAEGFNAETDSSIKLWSEVTYPITINNKVTLDLNNQNITLSSASSAADEQSSSAATSYVPITCGDDADLTLAGTGTLTGGPLAINVGNGTVTIKTSGARFNTTWASGNAFLVINGSLILDSGEGSSKNYIQNSDSAITVVGNGSVNFVSSNYYIDAKKVAIYVGNGSLEMVSGVEIQRRVNSGAITDSCGVAVNNGTVLAHGKFSVYNGYETGIRVTGSAVVTLNSECGIVNGYAYGSLYALYCSGEDAEITLNGFCLYGTDYGLYLDGQGSSTADIKLSNVSGYNANNVYNNFECYCSGNRGVIYNNGYTTGSVVVAGGSFNSREVVPFDDTFVAIAEGSYLYKQSGTRWVVAPGVVSVAHSLTLDGSIGVNTYLEMPEGVNLNRLMVVIGYQGNEIVDYTDADNAGYITVLSTPRVVTDSNNVQHTYSVMITLPVAPKDIQNELNIRVGLAYNRNAGLENVYYEDSYVPYSYINGIMDMDGLGDIGTAIHNYCAYAQANFGVDPHLPFLNQTVLTSSDIPGTAPDVEAYNSALEAASAPIRVYGSSLVLRSNTSMRIYFSIIDDPDAVTDVSIKVNGQDATLVRVGETDYCYVEISNIPIARLGDAQVVTVGDTEMAFCPTDYLRIQLDPSSGASDGLKNLLSALWHYYETAQVYFNPVNNG